jgi:hypothetical protein
MSSKIWVIPDIHGRFDLLEPLLERLFTVEKLDLTNDKLIFLGDMIDRGWQSREVVEKIRDLVASHPNNIFALRGNHEQMAIDSCVIKNYHVQENWLYNGGRETLTSWYGLDWQKDGNCFFKSLPQDTLEWFAKLPLQLEFDRFFFSHAPVPKEDYRNPYNKGLPFTDGELTWTRTRSVEEENEISRVFDNGVIGVCGHDHALSYKPHMIMTPRFYDHYIFADAGSGCYPSAPLVAIECHSRKVIYQNPKASFMPGERNE